MVDFRREGVHFYLRAVDMSTEQRKKPFNQAEISVVKIELKEVELNTEENSKR